MLIVYDFEFLWQKKFLYLTLNHKVLIILHYAVHILSKMNPLTHTKMNLLAELLLLLLLLLYFLIDLIVYVLYRSNWDMISNTVFVIPLIVSMLTVYAL